MANNRYCVELKKFTQAGFDVCLTIAALELPLVVIVWEVTNQINSLEDFEIAQVFHRSTLSEEAYTAVKNTCAFYLSF